MFHKRPSSLRACSLDVKMWKIENCSANSKIQTCERAVFFDKYRRDSEWNPKHAISLHSSASFTFTGRNAPPLPPLSPNPANHCRAIRPSHRISRFIPGGQTLLASQPPQIGLYFLHYFSYFPLCGGGDGQAEGALAISPPTGRRRATGRR